MEDKNEDLYREIEDILKNVAESNKFENYEVLLEKERVQGDGLMSDFFNGKVFNKVSGKTIAVAVKRAPENNTRAANSSEIIFKNELHFYSKVFPELDEFQRKKGVDKYFDNIPKFLVGNVDSKGMFIAMEDLKATGYSLVDKTAYLDKEHLEIIFKTYGKFHALSFVFKHENPERCKKLLENFKEEFYERVSSDMFISMAGQSFMTGVKTFDPVTEADSLMKLKKVENFKESFRSALNYKGNYSCLAHGDCWTNNMMFKYKDSNELEDLKLIDFQQPRLSTPIHDLSNFFYSGAAKEDMDKIDYYLDLYYQSFSDFARELGGDPEELFPFDVLKKEWKQYGFYGVFFGCQLWVLKLIEKNELANLMTSEDVSMEYRIKRINEVREGKEFKERTRNILLHAIEYGIIT